MGYSSELKTSLKQQETAKIVKEKIISPQVIKSSKFQDTRKVEYPFGQPYIDRQHDSRQSSVNRFGVQPKSSVNYQTQWLGSNTNKDDELVKHMSNLPGYLQRVEMRENLQEKALNFGVLDWGRLEKWKHNDKRIPARTHTQVSSSTNTSFMAGGSSTLSSTAKSKTLAPHRKQPASYHLKSSYEERIPQGFGQPRGNVLQGEKFETAPRSTLVGQQNLRRKEKSSGRNYFDMKLDKGKGKEYDQLTSSEKESSMSNWKKQSFPPSSHGTMNALDDKTKTSIDEEFNLPREHCPSGHQSIVLLLPKKSSKKSYAESLPIPDSRASFERKLTEANGNIFSESFSSEEHHSVELYSEIPHSCPLPVSAATNSESDLKPSSSINAHNRKCHSDASRICQFPDEVAVPSEGKCLEESQCVADPSTETYKRLDQCMDEYPSPKGKHPSPNRRFSFSLGRMSRSFSFKEGSSVPQLSSTYTTVKSGPVGSESSGDLETLKRDTASASMRARSSPLRRLLDPLLKRKGSHSGEIAQPSKGNSITMNIKPPTARDIQNKKQEIPGDIQNKKQEAAVAQALLRLTIKNGLPLFRFVVDNSNDILAATGKKMLVSGKDISNLMFEFFSVHEIKKKSGSWISQGSKGKSCGFSYNTVGRMKISSPYFSDVSGRSSEDQYLVRESILYSVDQEQDTETPALMPNRELAAIVVMNPSELNGEDDQSNCNRHTGEDEDSKSTTVILPGGIHGFSDEAVPSPLINRWRSGGSCDCGGWDVGCKLQILTDQGHNSKVSGTSISCSTRGRLDLFVQGGQQESKPIFSMVPLKNGLHCVDYNGSISSLKAFSICVAVISSQKSSDLFEVNNISEAKCFSESVKASDAKYVAPPPPSPVGRV